MKDYARNIDVEYSNRAERLVGRLSEALEEDESAKDIFSSPAILVPNWNVSRYLTFELSRRFGVAGDYFSTVEEFLRGATEESVEFVDQTRLVAAILHLLQDSTLLDRPELEPVVEYLSAGGSLPGEPSEGSESSPPSRNLRRYQLARRLANNFLQYGRSRLGMVEAWHQSSEPYTSQLHYRNNEAWQRTLWLELFDETGQFKPPGPEVDPSRYLLTEYFRSVDPTHLDLPSTVHVFGISNFAPVYGQIFQNLAARVNLKFYTLNPCREFWEDVIYDEQEEILEGESRLEERKDEAVESVSGESEWSLDAESPMDPPLALRAWGRAGRDLTHLLNTLSEYGFRGSWHDPAHGSGSPTLLTQFQSDVLNYRSARADPTTLEPDDSVRFFSCRTVRREVEAVADEIWSLVRAGSEDDGPGDISFEDIAVIVNPRKRDEYQSRIETVFERVHDLPFNEIDIRRGDTSRLMEGIESLLRLPTEPFNRESILSLLLHPNHRTTLPEDDRDLWEEWVERLAIFNGADRTDHEGTYIKRDVFNWDQGIKRLVLGTFMDGRDPDPEDLRFTGTTDSYRPETVEEERREALAAFAEGVRGLITSARSVRSEQRSLSGWFRWMGQFIREYLEPADTTQEPEFYGYLETLQSLAEMESGPESTGYSTAMEFALDELSTQEYRRGHYLASGVVVSSFKPQRPIPFDVVFMLGMNEGDFPASSPRSPIDLQSEQWQEGDLWDRDRERYMFLETLLSAREKVYLSWISRDPVTGKDIEPSSVFREFQQILEGYLEEDRLEELTVEHPLHRSDPACFDPFGPGPTYNPEALAEARACRARERVIEAHGWSKHAELATRPLPPSAKHVLAPVELPEGSAETPDGKAHDEIREVRLSWLEQFLKSPLQGWARYVLQLREEADETVLDQNDEPFETVNPWKTMVTRRSFEGACLERGTVPSETMIVDQYRTRKARYQEQGTIPTGMLGSVQDLKYRDRLMGWREQLNELEPGSLVRYRFGAASGESSTQSLDAIRFTLEEERGSASRFDLIGDTQLVDPDSSTLFFLGTGTDVHKYLRAYISGVALCAVGVLDGERFRVALVLPEQTETRRFVLPATEQAVGLLETWTNQLMTRPHAYRMPLDVVEGFLKQGAAGAEVPFDDRLNQVLISEYRSSLDEYGPVDDIDRYPPPRRNDLSPDETVEYLQDQRLRSFWEGYFEASWDQILSGELR